MTDTGDVSSVSPDKDSGMEKGKIMVIPTERLVIDGQNKEHPWYLFPEEDFDDLDEVSSSDSSELLIEDVIERENGEAKKKTIIKKENDVKEDVIDDEISTKMKFKRYKCIECDKTFKMKANLDKHQVKHLNKDRMKDAKVHTCTQCGYQATLIGNYKKHMLIHSDERPFKCHVCKKSFRQKGHLNDHLKSHRGVKDFECDECGATFTQKSSLKVHIKRHSGIKPHSCPMCERAFFDKHNLISHMRTHTGEKLHQCDTCGKTFSVLRTLKNHKMIHTGEKPYKCETCGLSFREKVTLEKHRAVHINVGPFPCTECGREFNRLASLILHSKIHSPNKDNSGISTKSSCSTTKNLVEEAACNNENSEKGNKKLEKENVVPVSEIYTRRVAEADYNKSCVSTINGSNQAEKSEEKTDVPSIVIHEDNPKQCENLSNKSPSKQNIFHTLQQTETSSGNPESSKKTEALVENIAIPDHVQQALEYGTVLKTKDDKGNDLIVVLPATLVNRDLLLTSQNTETTITFRPGKQATPELFPSPSNFDMDKELDRKQVTGSQKVMVSKSETAGQVVVGDMCMDDSQHASNDDKMAIEIYESDLDDEPIVTESHKYDGENIQEIHSDSRGLSFWDSELVINALEVQKEHVEIASRSPVKVISLRILKNSGDSKPKKRKKASSGCEEKRNIPRKTKAKKEKVKKIPCIRKEKKARIKRPLECQQCGKTFKISSNLSSHMRTHSGERPYVCNECGNSFKQMSHLKAHVRVHTGEKPYACDQCNVAYTQSSRLKLHKKNQHGEERKVKVIKNKITSSKFRNFYCPICKKTFLDECFKTDHMREHKKSASASNSAEINKKNTATSDYKCDICGVMYTNKTSLSKHTLGHADFKFICEICGESFQDDDTLQSHRSTAHDIKIETDDVSGLFINVKIGSDEDFVVVNPSVKCILQGGNNSHNAQQNMNHSQDDVSNSHKGLALERVNGQMENEVTCGESSYNSELKYQGSDFLHVANGINNENILNHSNKEENGLPVKKIKMKHDYINSDGKKIWECKICSKIFYQSSNFHCHMRFHTGEKPYKCNICSKDFRQISHLKEHMHKHTGLRSYGCSTCEAHFSQRGAAKRHIQVKHDGKGEIEKVQSYAVRKHVVSSTDGSLPDHMPRKRLRSSSLSSQEKLEMDNCSSNEKRVRTKRPRLEHDYINSAGRKIWECKLCKKTFFQSSNLHCHMRSHTGEKPFKCNVCPKAFKQSTHLKEHMQMHFGTKSFGCSACGARFIQRTTVKRHIEAVHKGEGEIEKLQSFAVSKSGVSDRSDNLFVPSHSFIQCKASSSDSSGLTFYKKTFNEGTGPENDSEKVIGHCNHGDVCNCEYRNKNASSKKRTFNCRLCMLHFASKSQLESHLKKCCPDSDSETSVRSEDIPYQDDSDVDVIRTGRRPLKEKLDNYKSRQMKTDKTEKCTRELLCSEGLSIMPKESLESITSELQAKCKICGVSFRRTSALKFHYNMKHGNLNGDVSEDDEDIKNKQLEINKEANVKVEQAVTDKTSNSQKMVKKRKAKGLNQRMETEEKEKVSKKPYDMSFEKKKKARSVRNLQKDAEVEYAKKETDNISREYGQNRFHCDICNISFQKPNFLALHMGSRHSAVGRRRKVRVSKESEKKNKGSCRLKYKFFSALKLLDNSEVDDDKN